jgi:hypothetical protein
MSIELLPVWDYLVWTNCRWPKIVRKRSPAMPAFRAVTAPRLACLPGKVLSEIIGI